jgi:hypothetical protein
MTPGAPTLAHLLPLIVATLLMVLAGLEKRQLSWRPPASDRRRFRWLHRRH